MALIRSERIELIREISNRLKREGSVIPLTLKQYGFAVSDGLSVVLRRSSVNEIDRRIVDLIENTSDETLVQLAAHLGYQVQGASGANTDPGPEFWEPGHFRLFISHLSGIKDYAQSLQESLGVLGVSGFVAHNDIVPTKDWEDEIVKALETTDALVALLSPGFHASDWTDQEVGFVMGRGRLAVAVRMGEEPYGFVAKLQAFQGNGKTARELATEMFEAFISNELTREAMAPVVVSNFVTSGSFASAKKNVEYLEKIGHWEPGFSAKITRALETNSQVEFATGVPDRVRQLVDKWAGTA